MCIIAFHAVSDLALLYNLNYEYLAESKIILQRLVILLHQITFCKTRWRQS